VKAGQPTVAAESSRDDLYRQAAAGFGDALDRLARAYEADADTRRDLLQEIHFALWRSFGGFDGRCSLRTWVYRVAHNAAASHVIRQRRANAAVLVGLEEIEAAPDPNDGPLAAGRREALERLLALIRQLKPLDLADYLFLSGRAGRGLDRRNYGPFTGQRGDQDPPHQDDPDSPISRRRFPCRMNCAPTTWERSGGGRRWSIRK
jgi:RNA polymerase sigma-70 factor (ECF subfamily)